jgi:hypothetical protein
MSRNSWAQVTVRYAVCIGLETHDHKDTGQFNEQRILLRHTVAAASDRNFVHSRHHTEEASN